MGGVGGMLVGAKAIAATDGIYKLQDDLRSLHDIVINGVDKEEHCVSVSGRAVRRASRLVHAECSAMLLKQGCSMYDSIVYRALKSRRLLVISLCLGY